MGSLAIWRPSLVAACSGGRELLSVRSDLAQSFMAPSQIWLNRRAEHHERQGSCWCFECTTGCQLVWFTELRPQRRAAPGYDPGTYVGGWSCSLSSRRKGDLDRYVELAVSGAAD